SPPPRANRPATALPAPAARAAPAAAPQWPSASASDSPSALVSALAPATASAPPHAAAPRPFSRPSSSWPPFGLILSIAINRACASLPCILLERGQVDVATADRGAAPQADRGRGRRRLRHGTG